MEMQVKIGWIGFNSADIPCLEFLKNLSNHFQSVGCYVTSGNSSPKANDTLEIIDLNQLIQLSDCLVISLFGDELFEYANKAIRKRKHIFLQNPYSLSTDQARALFQLSEEANSVIQIEQPNRFHKAFINAFSVIEKPLFLDIHYQTTPNAISSHSTVRDLFIQSIGLVGQLVPAAFRCSSANGINFKNETTGFLSARLEFDNRCVANFTISQIAEKPTHTCHIVQSNGTVAIDFLKNETTFFEVAESCDKNLRNNSLLNDIQPATNESGAVESDTSEMQIALKAFHSSIVFNKPIVVGMEDCYRTLDIAHSIYERLKITSITYSDNI